MTGVLIMLAIFVMGFFDAYTDLPPRKKKK